MVDLLHPCLEETSGPEVANAPLNDSQRIAVLLSAAAFLAHLEEVGHHLPQGFSGARVAGGIARAVVVAPGSGSTAAQEILRRFLEELFGREPIAGRGPGRRAARRLRELWSQSLLHLPPQRAVEQIFRAAPFLWQPPYGAARATLMAQCSGNGDSLRIVGPWRFRRFLLEEGQDRDGVERLLEEGGARLSEWWFGNRGRLGARGFGQSQEKLVRAQELYDLGLFEEALQGLGRAQGGRALLLRLECQRQLGRLEGAKRTLNKLAEKGLGVLSPELRLRAADVALRLLSNIPRGDRREGQDLWLKEARRAGEALGVEGKAWTRLLAAFVAWDEGELATMREQLQGAQDHAPRLGWRWHEAKALFAMSAGDGEAVVEHLSEALGRFRRQCRPFEAAALWNDLGIGRAQLGDLAGAERAFGHAQRLLARCQGPRATTLGLYNLAEIRLRRGRLSGVRETLERTTVENRLAGNLRGGVQDMELWARYEMLLGRYQAALTHLQSADQRLEEAESGWRRPHLRILEARALGALGRKAEAAEILDDLAEEERGGALAELEPEEVPALWALAGRREEALASAQGTPLEALWRSLLTHREVPTEGWDGLQQLEPYRAARLVLDAERWQQGSVPARWRRRAADTFRRLGAPLLANPLEALDLGPWQALHRFLARDQIHGDAVQSLLTEAGYGDLSLQWLPPEEAAAAPRWIFGKPVEGDGVPALTVAAEAGGHWRLFGADDAVVRALFQLAVERLPASSPQPRRNTASGWMEAAGWIGESPELVEALDRLHRLASSEMPLLLHGESGTGKELAARSAHARSARSRGPFVPLNCAALSETLINSDLFGHVRGAFTGADRDRAGVFETAQGGTVFLDEIGDLPLPAQGLLLRVLQEGEVQRLGESLPRPVNARLLAATHRNLSQMVEEGTFRKDLFYRLKVASITLPPLRERGADVVLLAEAFLKEAQGDRRLVFSPQAQKALQTYPWPGNVRELKNVVTVAATLASVDTLQPEHLEIPTPESENSASNYRQAVDALKRKLIREALQESGGNRSEAARRLGLTRQAMTYLIRGLKLDQEF